MPDHEDRLPTFCCIFSTMLLLKKYLCFLLLAFVVTHATAQNLTGTWEGELSNDQFLQLNIIQTGDKICGYTFDHVKADSASYCKAFFEGRFDRGRQVLFITGQYFLKNSGTHTLMRLELHYDREDGAEVLLQDLPLSPESSGNSFFRFLDSAFSRLQSLFGGPDPVDSSDYVRLKKVSDQPYEFIDLMQDCIARDKKKTDVVIKSKNPPKDSLPVIKNIPDKPKDSLPVIVQAPPEKKKDTAAIPKTVNERINKEQSRITVNTKHITLKVYDNAIVDGDTVSILYNGKILLAHQRLTEKGIEIKLELDEKQTRHEITLFAENLGSIPPNTALIVITAGDKRYELFAKASLEENAVLVFDYVPK